MGRGVTLTFLNHFLFVSQSLFFFLALSIHLESGEGERIHHFNMNINILQVLFGITMKADRRPVTTMTFKNKVWFKNTEAGGYITNNFPRGYEVNRGE